VLLLLSEASEEGGLQADIYHEFAMGQLIGPIMHRHFLDEPNVPVDLPERVVDYFPKAFARREN
jgi:hypothetical protein